MAEVVVIMDRLTKEERSKLMGKIKSKNTKIEKAVYEPLIELGFEYQAVDLFGKPDYVHRERRLIVFIDGCFFHACPEHCKMPITNFPFWFNKFIRNTERDLEVNTKLMVDGWMVIRIWGHSIKKDVGQVLAYIEETLKAREYIDNRVVRLVYV